MGDIRKFFSPKGGSGSSSQGSSGKNKRKAKALQIDSDSDEDSPVKKAKVTVESPKTKIKPKPEVKSPNTKIKPKPEVKSTSVGSFFGSAPIKRSDAKVLAKKKVEARDFEMHDDKDFLETLDQLDEVGATPTKPQLSLSQKLSKKIQKDENKNY